MVPETVVDLCDVWLCTLTGRQSDRKEVVGFGSKSGASEQGSRWVHAEQVIRWFEVGGVTVLLSTVLHYMLYDVGCRVSSVMASECRLPYRPRFRRLERIRAKLYLGRHPHVT
jgi:hypothetical protein